MRSEMSITNRTRVADIRRQTTPRAYGCSVGGERKVERVLLSGAYEEREMETRRRRRTAGDGSGNKKQTHGGVCHTSAKRPSNTGTPEAVRCYRYAAGVARVAGRECSAAPRRRNEKCFMKKRQPTSTVGKPRQVVAAAEWIGDGREACYRRRTVFPAAYEGWCARWQRKGRRNAGKAVAGRWQVGSVWAGAVAGARGQQRAVRAA